MRGYVERMELLEYFKPEGESPSHDEIMDSYHVDLDEEE